MITRTLEYKIKEKTGTGKAIVLIGARQVGKTTLIKRILEETDHLFLDADDPTVRSLLSNPNTEQIRSIIGNNKIVFIDEAQRIPGIGLTLKIIIDQLENVQLFVSGSSAFYMSNILNEPLTGRKWEYQMFPISWEEYENRIGFLKAEQQLENRLLYGFYPDVINSQGNEKETLKNLVNSYLYRDILTFSNIRRSDVLEKLVQAIALQLGNEVDYNELSQVVGINRITVQKYIDILEQGFVVFRLNSFSRNIRDEIKKNRKIYFYDNGIRNMILGNFNPLELRVDKGALWENFLVSERYKQNVYNQTFAQMYFWRTKQQQEIDYVEDRDGKIYAYEFKWNHKKINFPQKFIQTYNADTKLISRKNFRSFVMMPDYFSNLTKYSS